MKKNLLFLIICFVITSAITAQIVEERYQRAKISYNSPQVFSQLELAGIPMDHGHKRPGVSIISVFSESELETNLSGSIR